MHRKRIHRPRHPILKYSISTLFSQKQNRRKVAFYLTLRLFYDNFPSGWKTNFHASSSPEDLRELGRRVDATRLLEDRLNPSNFR